MVSEIAKDENRKQAGERDSKAGTQLFKEEAGVAGSVLAVSTRAVGVWFGVYSRLLLYLSFPCAWGGQCG